LEKKSTLDIRPLAKGFQDSIGSAADEDEGGAERAPLDSTDDAGPEQDPETNLPEPPPKTVLPKEGKKKPVIGIFVFCTLFCSAPR